MERFVCVRLVQGWGLDLSIFQFDWWAAWTVFLMNADRVVYGRYGRSSENTVEALRKALEGALELHGNYPANKAELAGKAGTALPWKTTEAIPAFKNRKRTDGRAECIHCHNILNGVIRSYPGRSEDLPLRWSAPYPVPERMGVTLDPKERATVTDVTAGSPAQKAGIQAGDRIVRLAGQPILSIADVQWVLFSAPDSGPVAAELDRAGQKVAASVPLPPGWRTK
jgi:membrane-associated protease RseP (regulator of RpoE activity)